MSEKYYVVSKGRKPGIYSTWEECKANVDGVSGAVFKKYNTLAEAQAAFKGGGTGKPAARKAKTGEGRNTPKPELPEVVIYCDGACSVNPGPSGCGIAIYHPDSQAPSLLYGGFDRRGTNNIAELKAIVYSLEAAAGWDNPVAIRTDSMYSINCITKWAKKWKQDGWTKKGGEIKNLDLIRHAHTLYESLRGRVSIAHVRGHSGIVGNELADRMAVRAIRAKSTEFAEYRYDSIEEVLSDGGDNVGAPQRGAAAMRPEEQIALMHYIDRCRAVGRFAMEWVSVFLDDHVRKNTEDLLQIAADCAIEATDLSIEPANAVLSCLDAGTLCRFAGSFASVQPAGDIDSSRKSALREKILSYLGIPSEHTEGAICEEMATNRLHAASVAQLDFFIHTVVPLGRYIFAGEPSEFKKERE